MNKIFPSVKLRPQTPPIDKREIGDAAIPGERRIHTSLSAPPPPPTRAISQWARSLEWRHAVTLHTAVGKNCFTFFPFSCEACSLYLVLWLCGNNLLTVGRAGPPTGCSWHFVSEVGPVEGDAGSGAVAVTRHAPVGPGQQKYSYL